MRGGGIGDAVSLSRASRVVMLDDSRGGVKVPARDLARRVLSLGGTWPS